MQDHWRMKVDPSHPTIQSSSDVLHYTDLNFNWSEPEL